MQKKINKLLNSTQLLITNTKNPIGVHIQNSSTTFLPIYCKTLATDWKYYTPTVHFFKYVHPLL